MAVQASRNQSTVPFIRSGNSLARESEIIKQDAGRSSALAPFTVMGKSVVTVPTTGTADVGNTGDGTVTAVALAPGAPIQEGDWELECTAEVGDGGVFKLTDPGGNIVANDITMTPGAGGTTTFIVGGLTFVITDGAEDFDTGDLFVIAATADGDWVPLDITALNGGQIVQGIFIGDEITAAAIVAGDVVDQPILVGNAVVDENQVILDDGSSTLDTVLPSGKTVRDELAGIGIFAEDTIDIDEQEN